MGALYGEHPEFGAHAAGCGKAAHLAARGQDPVTRNDDRKRVLRKRLRHLARQSAIAEPRGNFAVRERLAWSNATRDVVDTAVEVRHAVEIERHEVQLFHLTLQQGHDVSDDRLYIGRW